MEESITIIVQRSNPRTGKRYTVEKHFSSQLLLFRVASLGESMEKAIVKMREELNFKLQQGD